MAKAHRHQAFASTEGIDYTARMDDNISNTPEPDENSAKASLDPAYIDPALEKLKIIIKGNGVKQEDIQIASFSGELLEVPAVTAIELESQTSNRTVVGKITGPQQVRNAQMINETIAKEQKRITGAEQTIQQIKETIHKRDDKGFGIHKERIDLPFLNKKFVYYEQCKTCHAKGQVKCTRCHGRGMEDCKYCQAVGYEHCHRCQGNGQVMGQGGQYQVCTNCHGNKRVPCTHCQQKKRVQCPICRAKGLVACNACNGQAWNSHVTTAAMSGLCSFSYDTDNVPDRLNTLIARLGPKLHKHVQITEITSNKKPEEGAIVLPYTLHIPHGNVEFHIKEQPVKAFAFGTQCKLIDMPPFLEDLIRPGMESLHKAANGQGGVTKHLQSAVRYKTIKHALIAVTKLSKAKAARAVLKKTPLGIRKNTIQQLILEADQALKNITQRQRQIGIGAGIVLAISLMVLYFFGSLQTIVQSHVGREELYIGADIAAGLLALALGYMLAQTWIKIARQNALNSIL